MAHKTTVKFGDDDAAISVATDLLQNSVVLEGGDDGDPALTYRAAWLGSPGALGAHALHVDAQVTPQALAMALQGRDALHGKAVRRPGVSPKYGMAASSFGLTFTAPDSLARERLNADPARQAEIDRAMIASANAALKHLQTTTLLASQPLLNGQRFPYEFAHGLAAVAIMDIPTERELGDRSELRVHTLILGVERADGEMIAPDGRPVAEFEGELMSRASTVLAAELAPPQPSSARLVGRDGVWVTDPLDALKDQLGPYASMVDDRATLYGEMVVERDDAWLERRLTEIGPPLEGLDAKRAATASRGSGQGKEAGDRLRLAVEDAVVLKARVRDRLSTHVHAVRAVDSTHRRERELLREVLNLAATGDGAYVRQWLSVNESRVEEWVAIKRELAVREREVARPEVTGALDEVPPNARTIGRGDVEGTLSDLRAERDAGRDSSDSLYTRRIRRWEISPRHPLDPVRDLLGEARTNSLTQRADALAEWLPHQPDAWVNARHAELGDPLEGLDRGAARELLRLERDIALRTEEIHRVLSELPGDPDLIDLSFSERGLPHHEAIDPRYEVQCREVNRLFEKLGTIAEKVSDMMVEGRHSDAWMANSDHAVRALAYANEVGIRRELSVRQEVERSLVEPPRHIVELIGPIPASNTPERAEWKDVTREIEHRRIATEVAIRDGIDPEQLGAPDASPDLDQRIDHLRAAQDMPSLTHEAGIEGPEAGI